MSARRTLSLGLETQCSTIRLQLRYEIIASDLPGYMRVPAVRGRHTNWILAILLSLMTYVAMQSASPLLGRPEMSSRSTTVLPRHTRPSSSACTGVLKRSTYL